MKKTDKKEVQLDLLTATQRRKNRRRVQTKIDTTVITEQHHRDQCNINMIVARAQRTGMLPQQTVPGSYMDVPNVDYHQALEAVRRADSSFHSLPAAVRARFKNNPGELLNAIAQAGRDPELHAELVEMGVLSQKPSQDEPQATKTARREKGNGGDKGKGKPAEKGSGEPSGGEED